MSFRTAYGNARSENGWRMCNRDECALVPGPFMNTAPLRRGAPELILGHFARMYHVQIEPIDNSVWGWSRENDVGNSNHLSGTALDINAYKWPMGHYRMSQSMVDKIEGLLRQFDGAIFWGRWWGYPDEMHYQMAWPEGDPRYEAVIRKINGPSPADLPTAKKYGPEVAAGFWQLIPPSLWPMPPKE